MEIIIRPNSTILHVLQLSCALSGPRAQLGEILSRGPSSTERGKAP
uniref:Uncharacterized protein n=1 Tax=Anguilla anguilla TaxID=7936 RepID=A0A0E9S008_ANGAN